MSNSFQLNRHLPGWLLDTARQIRRRALLARDEHRLQPILRRVKPLTMVDSDSTIELARHVSRLVEDGIPGDFVECGVWKGGSSFLMALLARELESERTVWLFDSFEGLPPPEQIDGPKALTWAASKDPSNYFDNCRASIDQVKQSARELGLESCTRFVKGWFEQTLPAATHELGTIALLRIDADWYSSVRCCLDHLYDKVAEGGVVVLDDYYSWDGCAIAVHEFLGERRLAHRIRPCGTGAYFRKS